MRVYNTWRAVKLSTTITKTIIQNLTGLTLLIKLGDDEPVSDINSLYFSGRTKVSDSIYMHNNADGEVWVRVLEPFEDGEVLDGKGIRRYITVINDEAPHNGFEIYHGAGLMDFGVINATSVFWELSDGTTSVTGRPSKVLPAGKSTLYTDFYKGDLELNAYETRNNYLGEFKDLPEITNDFILTNCSTITSDLIDLPEISSLLRLDNCINVTGDLSSVSSVDYSLNLSNCVNVTGDLSNVSSVSYRLNLTNCVNVTGDLSNVSSVTDSLNLHNCVNVTGDLSDVSSVGYYLILHNCVNVTGDLSDVSSVGYYLSLSGCINVVGDLSDVPNVSNSLYLTDCVNITGDLSNVSSVSNYLSLSGCPNIVGDLSPHESLKFIYLSNTGMSPNDTDQTIINLKNNTTITSGGILHIISNRTTASDTEFNYLSANGWTITEI